MKLNQEKLKELFEDVHKKGNAKMKIVNPKENKLKALFEAN